MRIVKRRTVLLIVICICLGFFIGFKIFVSPKKAQQTWVVPDLQDISKKFISEETLINQIHQKQELITLEIDMTEKVTLDDSWGSLEIFRKVQSISYAGTGTYVVDLSSLKNENITIDNKIKKIIVNTASPSVKSVVIREEKTEYQTPENGLLRFGEIKLTPEDNQMLLRNVKNNMLKKMSDESFTSQAKDYSTQTLKSIIQSIVSDKTNEPYNVEIKFQ
jgi:hypothetical protein